MLEKSSGRKIILKYRYGSANEGNAALIKKRNKIFLIYKEFQSAWSSCKVIYEEGLPNI
jgi:hypothetical protein